MDGTIQEKAKLTGTLSSGASITGDMACVLGKDGKDGKDGYTPIKGVDYFDGVDGKDGYTPIKGVDYFDGEDGKDGTVAFDDLTPEQKESLKGEKGEKGEQGESGVSITHSWNGTTLIVTSASGTSSANLKGEKGNDGGALYDLPLQRVAPSSRGWYRVASITTLTHSFSCKFDIAQVYSNSKPQAHSILITASSTGGIQFVQLNGSGGNGLVIPKIRVVREGYINNVEFYYSQTVQNQIQFRVYDIITDHYIYTAVSKYETSEATTGITEFALSLTGVKSTAFEGEFIGDVTGNLNGSATTAGKTNITSLDTGDLFAHIRTLEAGVYYIRANSFAVTSLPSGVVDCVVKAVVSAVNSMINLTCYDNLSENRYIASSETGMSWTKVNMGLSTETWTFKLEDGSTVTKTVVLG